MADVAGKLRHKLNDAEVVAALVEAGLTSPKLIKAASSEDVETAVGSENVSAVDTAFGRGQ